MIIASFGVDGKIKIPSDSSEHKRLISLAELCTHGKHPIVSPCEKILNQVCIALMSSFYCIFSIEFLVAFNAVQQIQNAMARNTSVKSSPNYNQ